MDVRSHYINKGVFIASGQKLETDGCHHGDEDEKFNIESSRNKRKLERKNNSDNPDRESNPDLLVTHQRLGQLSYLRHRP
ncbi:Protein of unknown function [Cotesia congregata]|uniref:Uncharacterized protein n=1 Tax=Cotesia congregata TaxID=51543 RepID=A0A8J2H3D1_COTCN|nr:Protein of unknown function [Cotesia congregata]